MVLVKNITNYCAKVIGAGIGVSILIMICTIGTVM